MEQFATCGAGAKLRVLKSSVKDFGQQLVELPSRGDFALRCAYCPDGSLLATGTEAGQVNVFDTGSGSLVQSFPGR